MADEIAPLLVVDEVGSQSPLKNHTRDIHLLSCAFLFISSAYHAAQNLESTLNKAGDLGNISLGVLYTSYSLFLLVASPIVRCLGSKWALVIGTSGYLLFIASNLLPSMYTMVPSSLYLGFVSSLMWVGQGTYLTSAARGHAKDWNLHEGDVIGDFNGEFWGIYASTQVLGNLISLALLRDGKEGGSITGTNLLFSVFLGCEVVGVILMCFLSRRDEKGEDDPMHASPTLILKSITAPMVQKRLLLVIPLLVYSGLEQAFVWSVFTKDVVTPSLGVSGVGGAMVVFGASDAVCSLVAGRLASNLSSITLIVSGGAVLQIVVLLWLLFTYSCSSGVPGVVYLLLMAGSLGIVNGVFNTQINALIGLLFVQDMEGAFAHSKFWQAGAAALVFFLSPYMSMQVTVIVILVSLCIGISGFLFLALHVEKSSLIS